MGAVSKQDIEREALALAERERAARAADRAATEAMASERAAAESAATAGINAGNAAASAAAAERAASEAAAAMPPRVDRVGLALLSKIVVRMRAKADEMETLVEMADKAIHDFERGIDERSARDQ